MVHLDENQIGGSPVDSTSDGFSTYRLGRPDAAQLTTPQFTQTPEDLRLLTPELGQFQQWLIQHQPDFHLLTPSEQVDQARSYHDHFAVYGSLPPLPPFKPRIFRINSHRVLPNPKVQALVHDLETQLVRTVLSDTLRWDYKLYAGDLITARLRIKQIDDPVAQFLYCPLTDMAENLNGICQLHYNLTAHAIEYALNNANLAKTAVTQILNATAQIFVKGGCRLVCLFIDPDLLQYFLDNVSTYITENPPETKTLILNAIRTACDAHTISEMVYNRMYSLLSSTAELWNNLDFNASIPNKDPFPRYSAPPSYQEGQPDRLAASRVAHLETMEPVKILELYLRFFIPNTTTPHYTSIKDLFIFLTQPEILSQRIPNRPNKFRGGQCARRDLNLAEE